MIRLVVFSLKSVNFGHTYPILPTDSLLSGLQVSTTKVVTMYPRPVWKAL
jgi:hypothetical protein